MQRVDGARDRDIDLSDHGVLPLMASFVLTSRSLRLVSLQEGAHPLDRPLRIQREHDRTATLTFRKAAH
jgi:hypothetical protein